MFNKSRKTDWLGKLAVLSGAVLLALSGGQAAYAAESAIDPDQTGSINVHKYDQPETIGEAGDGTEQDVTGLDPIAGTGFTIQLVDRDVVDLTTNEGWLKAAELAGDVEAAAALGFEAPQPAGAQGEKFTDAEGLALFDNLPIGMYVVTETTSNGRTPAAPFVVTVPITDPDNLNNWLYNVHVYPKNSKAAAKTVDDGAATSLGDEVTWTIRGGIPRDGKVSSYVVADALDPRLEYVPEAVVSLENAPGTTLSGDDYEIEFVEDDNHPAGFPKNTVVVTFTDSGLEKLEQAGQESGLAQVRVDIVTKVMSLGNDGVIENTATIYPNTPEVTWDPTDPDNPGVVTPPVVTKWGNITFTKVGKLENGGDRATLEGAEFQVFTSEDDARNRTNPVTVTIDENGNPVTPPQQVFVSEADGNVVIPGLRYSKWANGGEIDESDPAYREYWIVETKAPEGYTLLAEPIRVEVNSPERAIIIDADGAAQGDLEEVINVPHNGDFELPNTGGTGTWLLTAGSLLLAGGAAAMLIRRSRRQRLQS